MLHVGGLLGGYLGDKAAVRYPNHGRIFVVQISVVTGPIFSLWLFKVWSASHQHACCDVTLASCTGAPSNFVRATPAPGFVARSFAGDALEWRACYSGCICRAAAGFRPHEELVRTSL